MMHGDETDPTTPADESSEFNLDAENRRAGAEIPVLIDQVGSSPHNSGKTESVEAANLPGQEMTNQAAWPSFPVVDTTFLGSGENHHKDEWDDDIPVIELTGLSHSEFPGPAHDEEFELLIEGLAEALQSGMARRLDGIVREAVEELVPKVIQRFNRDSENELRALIRQQLPSIRAQIMREIGESTQDPDD